MQQRDIVILGSTGSIGTQGLDIARRNPDRFRVVALAAGGAQPRELARQAVAFDVAHVGVADAGAAAALDRELAAAAAEADRSGYAPTIHAGPDAATAIAGLPCDVVLNGITGSIGLRPTLAALAAGSTLALANKESLIVGGDLVKAAAAPGQIVPVDSEHSALAQCLRGGRRDEVRRLVVTASGGPFRGRTRAQLADVTPAQALAHPTWDMGRVVTTNSATLVNKGLEVIEAHLLFDVDFDDITVVVHPQSVVHSMVEFVDGSTLAQASPPSMLIPISMGLAWPDRVADAAPACDWTKAATWEFFPLDEQAFRAVPLAYRVGRAGGTQPAVYNAANEECVEAFHSGHIGFLDIVDTVERVVDDWAADERSRAAVRTVEDVLAAEAWARARAHEVLGASR
ncbi:1-deoxy-D-xylulose-5-phosphate reductoisomerase [Kineosphaera limosa]|uniref:1-deoxy-D-xylulose 5-phosphate reductoisomerase n=1 Tax=Kineosphaera limosa NBRC 100340 TaxID=1184609 RepID=K6WRH4_9MICO|nr:1-deoxy-D-xylulose-5-phosphate reductoisomerase [Kineosphaera limosa]NYD99351.1 1-deoxy-D-xylulose-5-phosphate reductoisomerase [Kineosphaera limosa]GAB94692.1 1-deoxy-D-xylulose 5-phosphate reductoisomerase [Kineosphaera limosa NBRC 100340]